MSIFDDIVERKNSGDTNGCSCEEAQKVKDASNCKKTIEQVKEIVDKCLEKNPASGDDLKDCIVGGKGPKPENMPEEAKKTHGPKPRRRKI